MLILLVVAAAAALVAGSSSAEELVARITGRRQLPELRPSIKPCPRMCLQQLPEDRNELACTYPTNASEIDPDKWLKIDCQVHDQDEIVLGQRETVQAITPGSLTDMVEALYDSRQDFGQTLGAPLTVTITLSLMELKAHTFQGVHERVTQLRLYSVHRLHPDALIDLPFLNFLSIDSKRVPLPLLDSSILADDMVDTTKIPAFVRLQLADDMTTFGSNMPIKCHLCPQEAAPPEQNYQFTFVVLQLDGEQRSQTGVNYVHPRLCPMRYNGLGCPRMNITDEHTLLDLDAEPEIKPEGLEIASLDFVAPAPSPPRPTPVVRQPPRGFASKEHQINWSGMHLSLVLLAAWCTAITLGLLLLGMFMARRRRYSRMRTSKQENRHSLSSQPAEHDLDPTNATQPLRMIERSNSHMLLMPSAPSGLAMNEDDLKSFTNTSGFYTPSLASGYSHPQEDLMAMMLYRPRPIVSCRASTYNLNGMLWQPTAVRADDLILRNSSSTVTLNNTGRGHRGSPMRKLSGAESVATIHNYKMQLISKPPPVRKHSSTNLHGRPPLVPPHNSRPRGRLTPTIFMPTSETSDNRTFHSSHTAASELL